MIGLLLDRGANIDARAEFGWTPLHMAANIGRVDEVAFLVSRGADILIRTTTGERRWKSRWKTTSCRIGGRRLRNSWPRVTITPQTGGLCPLRAKLSAIAAECPHRSVIAARRVAARTTTGGECWQLPGISLLEAEECHE